MNVVDETLAEFGATLGIDQLRLNDQGTLVLSIQSLGLLGFDRAGPYGESVLVSLTRPLPAAWDRNWTGLLGATHFHARPPAGLQVGVIREQLVLMFLLEPGAFTLPRIHEAITALDRQHSSLEARR